MAKGYLIGVAAVVTSTYLIWAGAAHVVAFGWLVLLPLGVLISARK